MANWSNNVGRSMIDLKGKTALLTASGQGIGRATAKAFSEAGAYVIATDINHETLSKLNEIVDETHILDVFHLQFRLI